MTESNYFVHLEFRLCSELSGMGDKELRRFWCDGVVPLDFEVVEDCARITGWAYLNYHCSPRHRHRQEQLQGYWDFVLILGPGIRDRASVDWSKMLPASDVTGWLSLDFKNKLMTIEPLAAYPDRLPIERDAM